MKQKKEALHIKTKEVIEGLTEDEALQIVEQKWIASLVRELNDISSSVITDVSSRITYLSQKYATTMHDIQREKVSVRSNLVSMVGQLTAGSSDMEGLKEFRLILGGES